MGSRILGVGALLYWPWVLLHLRPWFRMLWMPPDAGILLLVRGIFMVLLMPAAGMAMLIIPSWFAEHCGPLVQESGEPYLDRNFWLLAGYIVLGLSWALLQLFS